MFAAQPAQQHEAQYQAQAQATQQQQQEKTQQQAPASERSGVTNAQLLPVRVDGNCRVPHLSLLIPPPPPPSILHIQKEEVGQFNDTEVLCGGSYSHPGNEWYHRFVKCNRHVYRQSATKHLVIKAIVKTIHDQIPPGRFVERDRKTGLWEQIPVMRAVDKTCRDLQKSNKGGEGDDEEIDARGLRLVKIPIPLVLAATANTSMPSTHSQNAAMRTWSLPVP